MKNKNQDLNKTQNKNRNQNQDQEADRNPNLETPTPIIIPIITLIIAIIVGMEIGMLMKAQGIGIQIGIEDIAVGKIKNLRLIVRVFKKMRHIGKLKCVLSFKE